MGKIFGRASERRLVSMSTASAEPHYSPPPEGACEVEVVPVDLSETDQFVLRLQSHKGRIVDFAVVQRTRDGGSWFDVARIDCCHGTIHRHQFDRQGTDVYDQRVIKEIQGEEPWKIVDEGYTEAYEMMFNEWEDNLRRWQQG